MYQWLLCRGPGDPNYIHVKWKLLFLAHYNTQGFCSARSYNYQLPGIWNKNQTLSKMCHVCVYYGVIIKKWTIFNKGEMAFLKFFCLFKQLKTRTALCIQWGWAASLQLVLILQIHKKRRQMHFLRVKEGESIRKREERAWDGIGWWG